MDGKNCVCMSPLYGVCINLCIYLSLISQVGAGLGTGDEIFKLVLDRITGMDMDVFLLKFGTDCSHKS